MMSFPRELVHEPTEADVLRMFDEAVTAGDSDKAKAAFVEAQSELMRAVSKGVVHRNTGARKVSRLAARLKKATAAA